MSITHNGDPNRGGRVFVGPFWERLYVGEYLQLAWISAVSETNPNVPIVGFGNVPSSQIVWEGWNRQGIHGEHAKPIITMGDDLLTSSDNLMNLDGTNYFGEVKGKVLDPYWNNVIIDTKEISELSNAAACFNAVPIFIFHIRDKGDQDPKEYVGDMDRLPPVTSFYVAELDIFDGLTEQITNGVRGFRPHFELLTPAKTWLGCEDA
jgi:hypothetical protein